MKLRISENDEDQLRGTYYDTNNNKIPLRMEHLELVLYFQYANAIEEFKVVSSEFYFHKPITVHIELYIFYRFIHFLLYIGQY